MPTEAVQDYLKAIWSLDQSEEATTTGVAQVLGVASASVSGMLKKLRSQGLVRNTPYKTVKLTKKGESLALEVIRTHRLIESYLYEALGVPWDEVHDEAEALEHAISPRLVARIAEAMGNPTHDPHGEPIPPPGGARPPTIDDSSLDRMKAPAHLRVVRVGDEDAEALRYLAKIGIVPGAKIELVEFAPFGGPIWIKTDCDTFALGPQLAANIRVVEVA